MRRDEKDGREGKEGKARTWWREKESEMERRVERMK